MLIHYQQNSQSGVISSHLEEEVLKKMRSLGTLAEHFNLNPSTVFILESEKNDNGMTRLGLKYDPVYSKNKN